MASRSLEGGASGFPRFREARSGLATRVLSLLGERAGRFAAPMRVENTRSKLGGSRDAVLAAAQNLDG